MPGKWRPPLAQKRCPRQPKTSSQRHECQWPPCPGSRTPPPLHGAPPRLHCRLQACRAVGGSRNGGLSSNLHRTPGHRVLGGHERRFRLLSNRVSRPPHGIATMAPHPSSLIYLNKIRKLCEAEKIGSIGHKISRLNRKRRKRGCSTVQ